MTLAILLVEDHPINRRVALAMLARIGYAADVADDGPSAIAAAARRDYDVVLMDLQLPGLDGLATMERILAGLAGRPAPRFVAMTASTYDEDRAACLVAGMTGFVAKPIVLAELAAVLAAAGPRSFVPAEPDPLTALRQLEAAGEPGLVARLCRELVADSHARLGRMRAAFATAAYADLERECHSLRTSSALLGARALAQLAGALEDAVRAGGSLDGTPWLDAIGEEIEAVQRRFAREIHSS